MSFSFLRELPFLCSYNSTTPTYCQELGEALDELASLRRARFRLDARESPVVLRTLDSRESPGRSGQRNTRPVGDGHFSRYLV